MKKTAAIVGGALAVLAAVAAVIKNTQTIADAASSAYRWTTGDGQSLKGVAPPSGVDKIQDLPVRVLGTQHKHHPDGRYFAFDATELDALLNRTDWDDQKLFISKSRDGGFREAVVWRRSNGGPGTAHGRYLPEGKAGDWKAGDSIFVDPRLRGSAGIAPTKT